MGHRHRRKSAAISALAVGVVAALTGAATAAGAAQPSSTQTAATHPVAHRHGANAGVTLHSSHGVNVQQVARIGHRQLEVRIVPTDLKRAIGVRIILPVGYGSDAAKRYPSLYLFPGTSGHSYDWATSGRAVRTTKPYGLITIDSDIGIDGDGGSWFTNWVDTKTKLGPSRWESYDIHELIPWIDANLKTIPTRSDRAVAGLSMGGYGAMELAARHPDLFTMAMSFSGAPEIHRGTDSRVGADAIISATMVGLNGVEPDAPFGSQVSDAINWQGHDPSQLVDNLRGMKLWLATGNGRPGPYDDPVTNPTGVASGAVIESLAQVSTDHFHRQLRLHHIPSFLWSYGDGTHSFPYWARDLRAAITPLMKRFAHPIAAPRHVHYMSIEPTWTVFGWHAAFHRTKRLEFSDLSHATVHGFRLTGSGRAVIRTPHGYRPRAAYRIDLPGPHHVSVTANRNGQLRIPVSLGASRHSVNVGIAAAGHLPLG